MVSGLRQESIIYQEPDVVSTTKRVADSFRNRDGGNEGVVFTTTSLVVTQPVLFFCLPDHFELAAPQRYARTLPLPTVLTTINLII